MPSNIHVVMGSDEGMVSEEAIKLFNSLKPADSDEFSNDIIEGNADNAEHAFEICSKVNQALQTMSFFGGAKVVWLKSASFLGSDRTSESERAKDGAQGIIDVLEAGLPEDITFLVSATAIDKRRAFYKFLKAYADISTHDKPDTSRGDWPQVMAASIREKAKPMGLTFSRSALDVFVQLVGEDTRQVRNELEKLDLYLGPERREVEERDIEKMIPLTRAGVIFEIGRALQKRNGARALELIDQQLEKGESAIAVIRASLIPTIRNLFMARLVVESFKPPTSNFNSFKAALDKFPSQDLSWLPTNKSGALSAYPLFLSVEDALRFTTQALKKAMEAAHLADQQLVTTGLDPRMVLHKLVVELCGSKPPVRA